MKRNKGLLIMLLLIILISIAGTFITFDVSRTQDIKVSMFDLSAQLSDLQNWKKWNAALVAPHDSISAIVTVDKKQVQTTTVQGETVAKLTVINPAFFQLQRGSGSPQAIELLPTEKRGFTGVLWTSKMNGFQWLAAAILARDEVTAELNGLKKFAENTRNIYGFPIQIRKVTDLIICTKREIVPPGNLEPYITSLLSDIRRFLQTEKMPVDKDYYYVSSLSLDGGRVQLAAGIPVRGGFKPAQGIEVLKFPVGGNLLVGTYNGKPTEIQKIYTAMNKYVSDKTLSKVAQPLEKYTDDPAALKTKNNISMQLIYPIY